MTDQIKKHWWQSIKIDSQIIHSTIWAGVVLLIFFLVREDTFSNLIESIAWPVTALLIFFILRKAIILLIDNLGHRLSEAEGLGLKAIFGDQVAQRMEYLEERPEDIEAKFELINSLIDEPIRQHLILMNENNVEFPLIDTFHTYSYQTGRQDGFWSSGHFSASSLCDKLQGTDLIDIRIGGQRVLLTEKGRNFARWLVESNQQADFFQSDLGSWGVPIPSPSAAFTSSVDCPNPEQENDEESHQENSNA